MKEIKQVASGSGEEPWLTAIQVPIDTVPIKSFLEEFKKEIVKIRKVNPFCASITFDMVLGYKDWKIKTITKQERLIVQSIPKHLRRENTIEVPKATLIIKFSARWNTEEHMKKIHENLPQVVEIVRRIMKDLTKN
ncbi:MAG: hypothetical protein WCH65_01635 [bacterium]